MDRCRKIRKVVSFDRRRTDTRSIVDQKSERARNNDERKLSSSESSKGSLLFFGGIYWSILLLIRNVHGLLIR